MKISYYFCLLFLLPFVIFSCAEEKDPTPNLSSRFLTGEIQKTWRIVSFSIIEKENKNNKFQLSIENSCEDSVDYYDNYYTFYADAERTFEITEGPEKCSNFPHDDYLLQDFWEYDNATATLTFVLLPLFGEFVVPFTVTSLTERKLVIQFYHKEVNDRYIYQYVLNPVNE